MQPLTLTSNFNSGYYSANRLNQISLECDSDSPDNKSSSNSPKPAFTINKSTDREDSPVCEIQSTSQLNSGVLNQTIQYLNVANLTKNLSKNLVNNQTTSMTTNKMSKLNQSHCSTNNENNINRHNINNNNQSHNNQNHNHISTLRNMDNSIDKQNITPIVRFRRLLTSIYHHANDISSETGERVHSLILGLISSTCSLDDFQTKIQELINYPLRSHIINFIRSCLPCIQAELVHLARVSKQNVVQFVKQNESVFLETNPTNNSITGLNTLVDLDEMLLSASVLNQQLKRRYSPDFLLDNENQFNTNKRFHSLNTASPINKLNNSTVHQTVQKSINQPTVGQQPQQSKTPSKQSTMNGNATIIGNSNILQNHLAQAACQARTAMIEELMSNRFYQTPIQQQFNLINQHLNQQIHCGQKTLKPQSQSNQQTNLLHSNALHTNQMNNQINNQMNSQLNQNQLNNHLQANLILNSQLNKQQIERLALIERYDKEIALQSKQTTTGNNLRTNLNDLLNSHNRSSGLNSSISHTQQPNQLMNGQNLNTTMPQHQLNSKLNASNQQASANEMNNEEEWKAIDTMLNCIINMVEKTRRALNVLQQKSQENLVQQREQSASPIDWQRAQLKSMTINKNLNLNRSNKSATPPITALDADYLDLRKSKDQLFSSLNFASNPVPKISLNRVNAQTDLMSIEKSKMERFLNTIGRHAAQDHLSNVQEESQESCWNCGRKAMETCSGCNEAKYCGSFCQHKDWETHHLICGKRSSNGEQVNDGNQTFKLNNDLMANSPRFSNENQIAENLIKETVLDTICEESPDDGSTIRKTVVEDGLKSSELATDEQTMNVENSNDTDEMKEKKVKIEKEKIPEINSKVESTSEKETKESVDQKM